MNWHLHAIRMTTKRTLGNASFLALLLIGMPAAPARAAADNQVLSPRPSRSPSFLRVQG